MTEAHKENPFFFYNNENAHIPSYLDQMILNSNDHNDERFHQPLFKENAKTILEAKEELAILENDFNSILLEGVKGSSETLLKNIKQYYETGRYTMSRLGVCIRENNEEDNKEKHQYVFKDEPDMAYVDAAIFQEKLFYSFEDDIYPTHTRVQETPRGETSILLSHFVEAKENLHKKNQFQMLVSLKNSVCTAYRILERNGYSDLNIINKPPKLKS